MDSTITLALETLEKNKQAIIFTPSRSSAEKTAEDISKLSNLNCHELEKEILRIVNSPTKQCRRLSHCVAKGIAFHHSGLTHQQKELIEDNFRNGTVKIICATPTLAAGLSLPVFRVIIKSLKRFSDRWGMDWIPVLEYLQMAGRAGRPEYEAFGEAIVIAKDGREKEEIHERYILGEPEEIYSKLAVEPVLRTHLLSLISSGIIRDKKSMNSFFSQTFWAKQFADYQKIEAMMEKMIDLLEEWDFIVVSGNGQKKEKDEFVSAHKLTKPSEEKSLRPTALGKRISELYLDPLTAKHLIDCLENFSENKNTFSLLQMISHTLEMRPLLSVGKKGADIIQEELTRRYEHLLEPEPSAFDLDYDDFFNSIKTALFFQEWIEEKDEDYLLEKFDIRPGEIKVKLDTADWLLYSAEELAKIIDNKIVQKEIRKLRSRLEYGIKEELLTLIKLKNIGRIRARKLFSNGIKDLGDLKKVDITTLSQILGQKIAEDIKEQLGEEIKEIPKGKRKGQMSLEKY